MSNDATTWQTIRLGDIGQSLIGLTYSPSNVKPSGTLVLRSSNIQKGRLEFTDNVYVDSPIPEQIIVQENDILICVRNGSRKLIGKSVILDRRVAGQTFGAFMAVYRSAANPFLQYFFQSNDFKRQIDEHLGATINQITNRSLNSFIVSLPPAQEQRAIESRLRDVDDLIATLERLITKKQAIRQGMMQQLLTGRTRLPGYTEDWPSVTLGESGVVTGGGVDKTSNPSEESVLLLNYMDVYRMEFIDHQSVTQVVTAPSPKIAKCSIRAGDVFFTPTSETPDDIARSAVADDDLPGAVYSYHLVRWRPGPGWDRSYLAYAFSTEAFRSQASTLAAGSGTRYVVSMPGFRSLVVPRPPVDEQHAIGEALRDVSSEINVLFRRLAKARAMKTGMMQLLLTGRVRLPVEASA